MLDKVKVAALLIKIDCTSDLALALVHVLHDLDDDGDRGREGVHVAHHLDKLLRRVSPDFDLDVVLSSSEHFDYQHPPAYDLTCLVDHYVIVKSIVLHRHLCIPAGKQVFVYHGCTDTRRLNRERSNSSYFHVRTPLSVLWD